LNTGSSLIVKEKEPPNVVVEREQKAAASLLRDLDDESFRLSHLNHTKHINPKRTSMSRDHLFSSLFDFFSLKKKATFDELQKATNQPVKSLR
jgi:hypothetical protein